MSAGAVPSIGVSRRCTTEIGTRVPSGAVAQSRAETYSLGVVAAEDGLRLHDPRLAVVEVVVEVGDRRDERRVSVAQHARVVLGVGPDPHAVDGVGHRELVDRAAPPSAVDVQHPQPLEARRPAH